MTTEQEEQLRAMGADIAGAEASPWEPRCVMQALRSARADELHLTVQGWVDLEAIHSPLLHGEIAETVEEIMDAARIFGLTMTGELTAVECMNLGSAIREACARAFRMMLPMEPPNGAAEAPRNDGFGRIAPIWACLVTQCGLDSHAARAIRVDQALILIATHRRNQGWRVAGTTYALLDLEIAAQAEEEAARG